MPPPESINRLQDAVLWPVHGKDGYGQPIVLSPIAIKVRWNTERKQIRNSQGEDVTLEATVTVDRRIDLGSRMWLGSITDLPGTTLIPLSEWMEVVNYSETPDIKNRNRFRTVGVARFKGG